MVKFLWLPRRVGCRWFWLRRAEIKKSKDKIVTVVYAYGEIHKTIEFISHRESDES